MNDEATKPAEASPFAAPAQTAPAAPPSPTTEVGDTSYMDSVASTEPLIQPCTVQGVVVALEEKTSASGTPFINVAVQLYGDKMVFADGSPVSPGKRLQSTLFLSAKDEEKFKRTARQVKNFALALRNVPLDGKEEAAYKAWPPAQKIGVLGVPGGGLAASTASLQPLSQWIGTKVMVQIQKGKDMDGNPRNEFHLLAAATKPVERKARS